MANVPLVQVGTGNQTKVVEPVLLTGIGPDGYPIAVKADAMGNLIVSGISGGGAGLNRTVVANQAARYALSAGTASLGSFVYQTDTSVLYEVIDTANLTNANGWVVVAGTETITDAKTFTNIAVPTATTGTNTTAAASTAFVQQELVSKTANLSSIGLAAGLALALS